jgi:myo-inositol 2-dehydrogenase / D-chiro-inositol 1-dehydrogenase
VPFQIGFNRRFDPAYAELARAIGAGELGKVELFRSQSTDPRPAPEAYIASSAGFFRDSVIHDIDTARFVAARSSASPRWAASWSTRSTRSTATSTPASSRSSSPRARWAC